MAVLTVSHQNCFITVLNATKKASRINHIWMRSIGSCPLHRVCSNWTNKNISFPSTMSENNQSWHNTGLMADSDSNFLLHQTWKDEKTAQHVMPSCMKPKDYLLFATSRLVVSVQLYLHFYQWIAVFLYWLTSVMQQTINFHVKYYCTTPISSK